MKAKTPDLSLKQIEKQMNEAVLDLLGYRFIVKSAADKKPLDFCNDLNAIFFAVKYVRKTNLELFDRFKIEFDYLIEGLETENTLEPAWQKTMALLKAGEVWRDEWDGIVNKRFVKYLEEKIDKAW